MLVSPITVPKAVPPTNPAKNLRT
ncbi:uncharacterized protein METZ01_LOCUS510836, partial [marine metagenome]